MKIQHLLFDSSLENSLIAFVSWPAVSIHLTVVAVADAGDDTASRC